VTSWRVIGFTAVAAATIAVSSFELFMDCSSPRFNA
jgi:hypothetical protein